MNSMTSTATPSKLDNLNRIRKLAPVRDKLQRELKRLVAEAVGL